MSAPDPAPGRNGLHNDAPRSRVWTAAQIVLVRLRFFLVLLGILVLVASWDRVRGTWDTITRPAGASGTPVSLDTEYWCPMCPGVLSEWPGKCPVCNMALVRRKKGDATPLPDGVVARMQLSPYRIQLAGVRTSPVEYRPLVQSLTLVGFAEKDGGPGKPNPRVVVPAEVFEKDLGWVVEGTPVEAACDSYPGRVLRGTVAEVGRQLAPDTRGVKVRLAIDDPKGEVLPGMIVTARLQAPLARSQPFSQGWADAWRDRTAARLAAHGLFRPAGGLDCGSAEPLVRLAAERLLLQRDLVLAVPESAVVDTGRRKVVYCERMPGLFDGVEVVLGRRCGDSYPVLRGLEFGDRVVTAGALLIDAETRLNPSIAASYFGAAGQSPAEKVPGASAQLSATDQELIARQKVCPVTGEPLGSMGPPARVEVAGKTVFVCCKSCAPALKKEPDKYLAKLRDR